MLLSVGSMPRRVQIEDVKSAAWARVKHFGILTKPWVRKWDLSASERENDDIFEKRASRARVVVVLVMRIRQKRCLIEVK